MHEVLTPLFRQHVPRYPSNVDKRGFTLLELIAVIFILSLLAALVLPAFYSFGERDLKSEAGRTAALLRYLNDSAISAKERYTLEFDLEEKTLSWNGPEGARSEKMNDLAGIFLQSKGEVKEGQVKVFFGPSGTEEYLIIHLRNKERTMNISFNPISGRAKIGGEDAK